jgi:hypothetical protein
MQSKKPIWLCYNFVFGPVAQLVEQRIENPRVGSSILPQATSSHRKYASACGVLLCGSANTIELLFQLALLS